MADYNSSLPVRTENNGDVVSRISDGTLTTQLLTVNADGSVNITDNGGSLTVDQATHDNLNANANIQVNNTDVGNANPVPVSDAGGSITVDGTVSASNFPTTVDTNFGTVGANTIRTAAQIGNATGAADFNAGATGAQTLRTHANQGAPGTAANGWFTRVTDGTDTMLVNTDGSINVVIADSTPGTPINDYNTAAAIAASGTSNHTYTAGGAGLQLNQIEASGSGKMKIEVQIETGVGTGTYTTRFVQFNSTSTANMTIHIENPIVVATGVNVRIIRTNKDNQAQDVYSTISGYQL